MTSKEKLQNICNYIESSITTNQMINVSFIEMISSDDEVMLAEIKRQNRELAIDITLGEKEESEWDKRDTWGDQLYNTSDSNIISPKILSMSISKSPYKNHDEVYDYIINFIDKCTSNPKKLLNGGQSNQFDVKLGKGNYSPDISEYEKREADIRRIITKINLCSSVISIEGRIGPGKSVLIGKDNWDIFKEIERYRSMGLTFIYDENIDSKKVIVLRNNDDNHPGIFLIDSNGEFYIKETPNWHRQFFWFWIN